MKVNGEKLSLYSVMMRAIVFKEDSDIEKDKNFRIDKNTLTSNMNFVARITVNWLRHNDKSYNYNCRMRLAKSIDEKNQIRHETDQMIFEDYPELRHWYDRNEYYMQRNPSLF